jgi:uncharacterized protein (DUF2062 family)
VDTHAPGRRAARGRLASLGRYCRYRLLIPVVRSPHAAAYTARGVANGVFWGLTPTVGLQTIEILATWWIARRAWRRDSSLLQAFVWVWINNPLTMIPLYYVWYLTGLSLMGDAGEAAGYGAFVASWNSTAGGGPAGVFAKAFTMAQAIAVPTMIGCVPYAVVGAAVSYRWAVRVVSARRQRRAARGAVFQDL